jgi:hypothetical protein
MMDEADTITVDVATQTVDENPPMTATMKFLVLKYKCVVIFALSLLMVIELLSRIVESALEGASTKTTLDEMLEFMKNSTEVVDHIRDLHDALI